MIQTLQDWLTNLPNSKQPVENKLLLTANQRLSRHILRLRQLSLGVPVLPDQSISSFEQWRSNVWLHCQDRALVNGIVIGRAQEQFVWQQLLAKNNQAETLLADSKSLAKALSDARAIVDTWNITHSEIAALDHKESLFFLELSEDVRRVYEQNNWITPEQQTRQIIQLFENGALPKISQLGLYGFTELNPLQKALVTHSALEVIHLPIESRKSPTCSLVEKADWEAELEEIASWAQQTLRVNPATQIGIVIPNLQKYRSQIERTFIRQFDPDYLLNPFAAEASRPYELSIGSPLAEEPIIADALLLTQFLQKQFTKEVATDLLRSEFWGNGVQERLLGLQKLNDWPMATIETMSIVELLIKAEKKLAEKSNEADLEYCQKGEEELQASAKPILEGIQQYRLAANKLDFNHWNSFLKRYLKTLNWPGARTLNSREYQAVEQFKLILDELLIDQRCFLTTNLVTFPSYVAHLRQRLSEKVFQQQMPRKPIQISGTLEAIGLTFDKCWIANTTRSQFPEAPQPNPFLPLQIQKAFDTPRSSPQKELDYAEQLLTLFRQCADEVVFSYSKTADDEHQQVSPLLPAMEPIALPKSSLAENTYYSKYTALDPAFSFSIYSDSNGLPLRYAEESVPVRRGVNTLGTYAINPLYGYLTHRLGAAQPNNVYVGISPPQRGNVLHNTLEAFWRTTADSSALADKLNDMDALNSELEKLVSDNLNTELHKHLQYLPASLIALEKQRCVALLVEWLTLESYRAPFTVASTENAYRFELNTINFQVRVDRIDTITSSDNTRYNVLIDYKTGTTPLSLLQRAPLAEPQLPVYTQLNGLNASAVAIGQLQPNNCAFVGIGDEVIKIDGVSTPSKLNKYELPDEWETVLDWWHQELSNSVKGISEGNAINFTTVSSFENRFEHLQPFVRKNEQDVLAAMLNTKPKERLA